MVEKLKIKFQYIEGIFRFSGIWIDSLVPRQK